MFLNTFQFFGEFLALVQLSPSLGGRRRERERETVEEGREKRSRGEGRKKEKMQHLGVFFLGSIWQKKESKKGKNKVWPKESIWAYYCSKIEWTQMQYYWRNNLFFPMSNLIAVSCSQLDSIPFPICTLDLPIDNNKTSKLAFSLFTRVEANIFPSSPADQTAEGRMVIFGG